MEAEKNVVTYEARDGQQVKLSFATIKKFLVHGHPEWVTDQELVFFMGVCKSRALNPFAKDCYLLKFSQGEGAAIITAIDYFRKRAKVQKDCKGWGAGIIVERNKEIVYSNGLMLDSDTLLGGWFEAQPEGWEKPYKKEVNLKGYIKKKKDGSVTKFWSKDNQPSQIAKVAESQGLRTVWPDEFQQLYTPEEIGEGDMFKSTEDIAKSPSEDLNDKLKAGASTEKKEDLYKAEETEKKKAETEKVEETEEPKEDPVRIAYIKLKKTGFKPYVLANLQAIQHLPQNYQDEIMAKWAGFYDEPFPGSAPVEKVEEPEAPDETDDEKFMRLVDGAEKGEFLGDEAIFVKCLNREEEEKPTTKWCIKNCNQRMGCPSWSKYDAEIALG